MSVQRTLPPIAEPKYFPFPSNYCYSLPNGIPVYVMPFEHIQYTHIMVSPRAGVVFQNKRGLSDAVISLMKEGTTHKSSEEINDQLDFYGAVIEAGNALISPQMVLSTLTRHATTLLPLFCEIFTSPAFRQKEIDIWAEKSEQELQQMLQNVRYLGNRKYLEVYYGKSHPYAQSVILGDYRKITQEDLADYHATNYGAENIEIIVAGGFNSDIKSAIESTFGTIAPSGKAPLTFAEPEPQPLPQKRTSIEKDGDVVQNHVQVGCATIGQHHPDYYKLRFTTHLLGGYFGSRLMKTIREEKGYTYGIHAMLLPYSNSCVFNISCETATEYTQAVFDCIYEEIDRMQCELIGEDELFTARQYFTGEYLNKMSSNISLIRDLRAKKMNNIDPAMFYHNWWDTLQQTTPQQIMDMAKKYFCKDNLREIIAGKN